VIDVRLPSGVCRARAPARRPDPPLEEHITVADFRLEAEIRTEFGKGSARRTRRAGRVPAVLYGHGQDVVHLSLPAREFAAALRNGGANALLTVVLDGKEQLALTKAVQRDPIKRVHEHVDLVIVRRGEKVTVEVPVHVVGDTAPDTLVSIELNTVSLTAPATSIPESIEVDVTGRGAGEGFTAADLPLPRGATLVTDETALVVNLMPAPTAEALEAELEQAEAEAGIEREESGEAAEGAGEGDVVPEPLDQGSGESMDSAEKSAQND
jgi:large subunit ribosomal protein L25